MSETHTQRQNRLSRIRSAVNERAMKKMLAAQAGGRRRNGVRAGGHIADISPDKAAPQNSPALPGQVVSRVGNSGSTQSPAKPLTAD